MVFLYVFGCLSLRPSETGYLYYYWFYFSDKLLCICVCLSLYQTTLVLSPQFALKGSIRSKDKESMNPYCIFCKAVTKGVPQEIKYCYPLYQDWQNFLSHLMPTKVIFFFLFVLFFLLSYWCVLIFWTLNCVLWASLFVLAARTLRVTFIIR